MHLTQKCVNCIPALAVTGLLVVSIYAGVDRTFFAYGRHIDNSGGVWRTFGLTEGRQMLKTPHVFIGYLPITHDFHFSVQELLAKGGRENGRLGWTCENQKSLCRGALILPYHWGVYSWMWLRIIKSKLLVLSHYFHSEVAMDVECSSLSDVLHVNIPAYPLANLELQQTGSFWGHPWPLVDAHRFQSNIPLETSENCINNSSYKKQSTENGYQGIGVFRFNDKMPFSSPPTGWLRWIILILGLAGIFLSVFGLFLCVLCSLGGGTNRIFFGGAAALIFGLIIGVLGLVHWATSLF